MAHPSTDLLAWDERDKCISWTTYLQMMIPPDLEAKLRATEDLPVEELDQGSNAISRSHANFQHYDAKANETPPPKKTYPKRNAKKRAQPPKKPYTPNTQKKPRRPKKTKPEPPKPEFIHYNIPVMDEKGPEKDSRKTSSKISSRPRPLKDSSVAGPPPAARSSVPQSFTSVQVTSRDETHERGVAPHAEEDGVPAVSTLECAKGFQQSQLGSDPRSTTYSRTAMPEPQVFMPLVQPTWFEASSVAPLTHFGKKNITSGPLQDIPRVQTLEFNVLAARGFQIQSTNGDPSPPARTPVPQGFASAHISSHEQRVTAHIEVDAVSTVSLESGKDFQQGQLGSDPRVELSHGTAHSLTAMPESNLFWGNECLAQPTRFEGLNVVPLTHFGKKKIPRDHLQGIPRVQTVESDVIAAGHSQLQSAYDGQNFSYLLPTESPVARAEADAVLTVSNSLDVFGEVRPCPTTRSQASDGTAYACYGEQPIYSDSRITYNYPLPTTFSPILQGLAGARVAPQAYERGVTLGAEAGAVPVVSDVSDSVQDPFPQWVIPSYDTTHAPMGAPESTAFTSNGQRQLRTNDLGASYSLPITLPSEATHLLPSTYRAFASQPPPFIHSNTETLVPRQTGSEACTVDREHGPATILIRRLNQHSDLSESHVIYSDIISPRPRRPWPWSSISPVFD